MIKALSDSGLLIAVTFQLIFSDLNMGIHIRVEVELGS